MRILFFLKKSPDINDETSQEMIAMSNNKQMKNKRYHLVALWNVELITIRK